MSVLVDLMRFIDRELDAIEAERKRRRTIRDEALAHHTIEDELERQQVAAGRKAALLRVLPKSGEPSLWDKLTEKDMSY